MDFTINTLIVYGGLSPLVNLGFDQIQNAFQCSITFPNNYADASKPNMLTFARFNHRTSFLVFQKFSNLINCKDALDLNQPQDRRFPIFPASNR